MAEGKYAPDGDYVTLYETEKGASLYGGPYLTLTEAQERSRELIRDLEDMANKGTFLARQISQLKTSEWGRHYLRTAGLI
jgi:ABC-type cobalamin transport system ATPase subunit